MYIKSTATTHLREAAARRIPYRLGRGLLLQLSDYGGCRMSRFICLFTLMAIMTPTLQAAEPQSTTTHDGWTFTSARPEIAPQSSVHVEGGGYGLVIKGNGDAIADGRWVKHIDLPAGEYVSFTARYRA